MPLYEYQCDACGHRFEVIQKFSDAPITSCERCAGVVRKLISSPAIQFKGSGWYITDYARAGKAGSDGAKRDGASGESSSDAKTSTAKDTSSETKAKGDAKSSTTAAPTT